jgi:hypothetical protein
VFNWGSWNGMLTDGLTWSLGINKTYVGHNLPTWFQWFSSSWPSPPIPLGERNTWKVWPLLNHWSLWGFISIIIALKKLVDLVFFKDFLEPCDHLHFEKENSWGLNYHWHPFEDKIFQKLQISEAVKKKVDIFQHNFVSPWAERNWLRGEN